MKPIVDTREWAVRRVGVAAALSWSLPGLAVAAHAQIAVGSCEGCGTFDKISSIANRVETSKAPERIIAAHLDNGMVIRTRPLCAYPKVDRYKGAGDTNEAINFDCVEPQPAGR